MRHENIHNATVNFLSVNFVDDNNVKSLGTPTEMFNKR